MYNDNPLRLMGSSAGSYARGVAAIHKKYQSAIKNAKTRQAVLNAYWKHKKESENLLAKHLRDEMGEVKRIKAKMEYR